MLVKLNGVLWSLIYFGNVLMFDGYLLFCDGWYKRYEMYGLMLDF